MLSDLVSMTLVGALFWLGFIAAVIGAMFAIGRRGAVGKNGAIALVVGVSLAAGMFILAGTLPGPVQASVGQVPNTSVNTLLATSPSLVSGAEVWNQQTSEMTVYLAYNTTGNYYCVAAPPVATTHGCAAGGAGSASHPLDILFPLNLIRTDAVNTTALFDLTCTSVPTALSLGSTSTLGSIIGFKQATSTVPGQWQIYNSAGTQANQYPTVSAPSVSTNLLTDGIAVKAFSNTADTIHMHLAGTNSTSASEAFASAIQNFTAYNVVFSISQSSPPAVTVALIVLAWTT